MALKNDLTSSNYAQLIIHSDANWSQREVASKGDHVKRIKDSDDNT